AVAAEVGEQPGVVPADEAFGGAGTVVARLDHPVTGPEVAAVQAAVARVPDPVLGTGGVSVYRGDRPVAGILDHDRLDASATVIVGSVADLRLAGVVVAIVALVALAVALRLAVLTGRADDDLLELVGAEERTMRLASAAQALVLAGLAVPVGVGAGVAATVAGVHRYNGGLHGETLPVPVSVPPELLVAALAVPLMAAVLAWLAAARRPPVDPRSLADRLAW
ncbi:MAG TPA: FtsX-like permease family protein, partial [Acidimicrobiales bacterium]